MIRSLEDAVAFTRSADGDTTAIVVVDWTGVRSWLDRDGLWDPERFEAWVRTTPEPSDVLLPLVAVRYATPAAEAMFETTDLAIVSERFRQGLRSLPSGGIFALREFQGGTAVFRPDPTADVHDRFVAGTRLHRATRDAPYAITLLRAVEASAARRLHHSEARYDGIVRDQTDFVVRYTTEGIRTFVNRPYADFFGGKPEDFIGTNFLELVSEEFRDDVREKIRRLVSCEADVLTDEHLSRRHDGILCWTHWVDRAIFDEDGGLIELQAVGRDVTEQKEAERQRIVFEQRLAQAQKMEALGTLAGGLAHDFNNSLTGILGYSDLIRMGTPTREQVTEYAEAIRQAAEQASELTRSLLQLSRRSPARLARCDIAEIVESAARLLRASVPSTIAVRVSMEELPAVLADAGQLTQAIINLGFNARDAISGEGSIEIRASSQQADGREVVVLSVCDDGVGISDNVRNRLFEPFFTTKSEGQGTGLGLAMVYACVTAHGGMIEIETEIGRGTTFELHLPLPLSTSESVSVPEDLRGHETILLVDDVPVVLLQCRQNLESSGYRVLTASSGNEAYERFCEHTGEVDAVVTDLVMSRGTGRDVEQRLHALDPALPIVLMTGGLVDRGSGKFAAVLEKPFSSTDLLRTVRTVLDRRRASAGKRAGVDPDSRRAP